ncbi:hypothetical protein [Streptomyces naphthomycinicus]|uniref:hypothetical protein n=1 Tax=Streptomyces naphthomycinicus TaxID=2872625 RepID=UPI001CED8FA3|nr:hypothetical protein [Streptomyces sp. TML10]
MKFFSRTTTTVATGATAIAFGFTLLGPTSPAHASVAFRVQSVVNGKCMQWNGYNKAVTLATCKHKWSQIWSPEGTQLASDADQYGAWCLDDPSKREKAPTGRECRDSGVVIMNDKRIGHTTYMASHGGYFKTVDGKIKWGNRTSKNKYMQWKLLAA